MNSFNMSASSNKGRKRKRPCKSTHSKRSNSLLSMDMLVDVLACCHRSPTLDNIVVVSRKFSAVANRLPNLRSVGYIELERAQSRGRYDVDADDKVSEECTLSEAFEALIGYANFSDIGSLRVTVGDKKSLAKLSRQLWEQLVNIVAKCDILTIESVNFRTLHSDVLAKLSSCHRPSTVKFEGAFGASSCIENVLRSGSPHTTIMTVRPYRDASRRRVGLTDEGILRFLFERQYPPSVEVKLSIECATVTKTFLRDLIERASSATHDFTLYIDCVDPDEQEGLEPCADHIEDDRLTTGQNAVSGRLPSGLNFLFNFETGGFWSLRVGTKPMFYLKAVS